MKLGFVDLNCRIYEYHTGIVHISQGSVATRFGVYIEIFYDVLSQIFRAVCSERMSKIDQYLAKTWTKAWFLWTTVYFYTLLYTIRIFHH